MGVGVMWVGDGVMWVGGWVGDGVMWVGHLIQMLTILVLPMRLTVVESDCMVHQHR